MTPIHFRREDIHSSPIAISEKTNVILLKACKVIETTVEKGLESSLVDQSSEIDDNKIFLQENLESEDKNKSDKEDGVDKDLDDTKSEPDKAAIRCILQDARNASSNYGKEKLVQIFEGEQLIPKQR